MAKIDEPLLDEQPLNQVDATEVAKPVTVKLVRDRYANEAISPQALADDLNVSVESVLKAIESNSEKTLG
jgi:hypothetical protein